MFDALLQVDPLVVAKISDFFLFIVVVSVCAGVLYLVYRRITPHEVDELEFASTVFILTIAIGLLVSIIKHAPAISFGLFGAMSIVRFRAQIKRPQRMIFIFMAAAIGVCCGAGEYVSTILGTIVLSALTLVSFSYVPARTKDKSNPEAKRLTGRSTAASSAPPVDSKRWAIDFQQAKLADGSRYRILVVVDEANCAALAIIPETSFSGARVVGELDRLIAERGKPDVIASEPWPQFASQLVLDWRKSADVRWEWIDQYSHSNFHVGSVSSEVVDVCHSMPGYATLQAARASLDTWRQSYNGNRSDADVKSERSVELLGPRLAVSSTRDLVSAGFKVEPLLPSTKSSSGT